MITYFTSDLHLGHEYVAWKRGFRNAEEHDKAILDTLKATLKKRDTLWILGDVGERIDRLKDVPGRKKLIGGNHDGNLKSEEYTEVFESVHGMVKYKNMWLTHCSISSSELLGKPNVCGHWHLGGITEQLPFPYIYVTWELWNRPVSLEEIKEIINANL